MDLQRWVLLGLIGTSVVAALGLGLWIFLPKPPTAPPPEGVLPPGPDEPETLAFSVEEGRIANHFYRRGEIAAHLVLTSGDTPRVIVAFPAGNSGAGIWFEAAGKPVRWTLADPLAGTEGPDGLRGIRAKLEIDTRRLVIRRALMGSVRILRDFMHGVPAPEEWKQERSIGETVRWSRAGIGDRVRYLSEISPIEGATAEQDPQGRVVLVAAEGSASRFPFQVMLPLTRRNSRGSQTAPMLPLGPPYCHFPPSVKALIWAVPTVRESNPRM